MMEIILNKLHSYLKRACEFITSSGMKQDLEASFVIPEAINDGLNAETVPNPGKLAKLTTRSCGLKCLEIASRRARILDST